MRVKVSNYISQWLVDAGICQAFMVTGGGAMHLDDALGHQPGLACIYNHHEQACAIAAEGYARIHNRIAALCVTTGPGGTNAITGVLGGWLDSIPMLILSGQVRYDTTARWSGVGIRAMGDQEFDICQAISCMTKYSEMVIIAYEPVWAIGTGKTATAAQANEVCALIRATIADLYSKADADALTIQYGGSMNAKNAEELLDQPDVDGGLIGGASLKPEDFAAIVKAASR